MALGAYGIIAVYAVVITAVAIVMFWLLTRREGMQKLWEAMKHKPPESLTELPCLAFSSRSGTSDFIFNEIQINSKDFDYDKAEAGFYRMLETLGQKHDDTQSKTK